LAKRFIHYALRGRAEYAYIYTPRKVNGKKTNDSVYLGRVVDKQKGIYRNRKQGLFTFSLEEGFGVVPDDDSLCVCQSYKEERLILDFGDAYCLYATLRSCDVYSAICEILPEEEDTMMSLLGFKLLADMSNRHAEDWWEGSYTRVLYPNAKLRSQRISEFYQRLGSESVHRNFFNNYLNLLCKNRRVGVLIDSTGMPNDICFPLTAISTHNGVTNNETRLLYVVDRKSGMPLFFRYNAGNIVDVSTLRSTIAELEAIGIDTDFAILDSGYYSEGNIRSLYGDGDKTIPFLTRLGSNRKLYKTLVADHAEELTKSKYMLMQRNRLISIKRVEVDLFGNTGFAYIAIDHARREDEVHRYAKAAIRNKDISHDEMDNAIKVKGLFILVSSEKIETDEVLPLYYTRQTVEQIFDICKNNADLLPLRVHNEDTFRGHLLLSFIATIAYLTINLRLKDSDYHAEGALFTLRNQKCKVYDNRIIPKEPNKKMNDIYKLLKINPPVFLPGGGNN